jgi:pimeloyl-ACP methyl ester carboxylesterase
MPDQLPIECFDLNVPEDYSKPYDRRIRLHVAVIKSSSKTPSPDPLLILFGGPGANTLDRMDKTMERFSGVLASRDIILFDQRGVGYSQPSLNCPEIDGFDVMVIDKQLDNVQEFESRLAAYRICRNRLKASGVALSKYSADALTADLATLRLALGYDEWNLYGVSYGARQVLLLMRDYPLGLRSVILDSVYPVEVDLAKETVTTHTHALDMLFTANEALYPEFEQAFFSLVNELDTSPINVPALIPERWVFPYQPFNGDDLLRLMIGIVSRWPQSFPHMPRFIDDIRHGNYVDLMELVKPSTGDQLFSEGMNLSVICQEIDPEVQQPINDTEFATDPRLYEYAITDLTQRVTLCKLWLGKDWELRPQTPVVSPIPALLLRGEQDAVIPPSWSMQAAKGLSNSYILSFPNTGHGVANSNTCAREAIAVFLRDPSKMPNTGC